MKIALKDWRGMYGGTWDGPGLVFDRIAVGAGETFEVVWLDDVPIIRDGLAHPQPKPEPPSAPPPMLNAAYVAAVKAQLEVQGLSLAGSCGAFQITRRVAWGLREAGIGLLSKPSGNNCDGYSVDYVCYRNGDAVDILGDAGGDNVPIWILKTAEVDSARWRAPVQP